MVAFHISKCLFKLLGGLLICAEHSLVQGLIIFYNLIVSGKGLLLLTVKVLLHEKGFRHILLPRLVDSHIHSNIRPFFFI